MQSGKTPTVQNYFNGIKPPEISDMELQLEQLVNQGTISPEEAQTIFLEKSKMNDVNLDPSLKQAQIDALSQLQNIGSMGGLTAQDRAKLGDIKSQEDAQNKGKREAILQNARARGVGGSGLELAAQLQGQQDSASRQSQRDMDVAALAEQRALDAIMQSGSLAGNISNQQFGQQAQIAGANDAISKFNAANQQQQINQNVAARNDAAARNLAAKQVLANQNTELRNQQQQYNKGLKQQDFENLLNVNKARAGIAQSNANAQGANSAAKANATNNTIGTGLGAIATIYGGPAAGVAAKEGYSNLANSQNNKNQAVTTDTYDWQKNQNSNQYQFANGGLVPGENTNRDTQAAMLMPGEMVIKKEDVPNAMEKMHVKDDGTFDVAGFLDMITGHKYNYKKGK